MESLARAARQVTLYGPDHPMSLSAATQAITRLEEERDGVLEIHIEEDHLWCNRHRLQPEHPQVAWLRQAMHQRVIASIAFRTPVRGEEVVRLLTILSEDPTTLIDSGGAVRAFSAAPSSSVTIADADFARELRESERAWLDSCQKIEPDAAGPLAEVVQYCLRSSAWGRPSSSLSPPGSLPIGVDASYGEDRPPRQVLAEALARLIQQAGESTDFGDEQRRRAWRLDILRHLKPLGPEWLGHIFRSPSGASSGYPDILTLIARELSPQECVSLVLDYPGAIVREPSGGLGLLLARVMSDAGSAEAIEPLLHEEAMRRGIAEQLYRNVVSVLTLELDQSADSLPVSTAPDALLPAQAEEQAQADLSDLLHTLRPHRVRQSRLHMLMEIAEFDLSMTQYVAAVRLLTEAIQQEAAREGEPADLVEGLRVLRRLSETGEQSWRSVAEAALLHMGTPAVVAALAAAAGSGPEKEGAEAADLLGTLGDAGMEALAGLARGANPGVAERAARAMLAHDAPAFRHVRDLLSAASADTARQVLRAAISGANSALLEPLRALVGHPDPAVRLEVVNEIGQHAQEGMDELLARFIWDLDLEVRTAAIQALGARRATAAVPPLCALVRRGAAQGEPWRAREAAILALGKIGAPEAAATLAQVLGSGGLMDLLRGSALRIAAAHALAGIATPEAREALEKGAQDRQRPVREACRQALLALARASRVETQEPAHVS